MNTLTSTVQKVGQISKAKLNELEIFSRPKPRRALRMWHRHRILSKLADRATWVFVAVLLVVGLLTLGQIFLPII